MKTLGLAFTLIHLLLTQSHAGPNEGGALAVHGNVNGSDVSGNPCASIPIPASCFDLVNVARPDGAGVEWFVVVATGVAGNQLWFNTIVFGLGDYDSGACQVAFYGPCIPEWSQPLEIPSQRWPGPRSGTAVSWAPDCLRGEVVPVYYFGVYAYGDGGTIPLADAYPGQNSMFVSCESPPSEDPIAAYGEFHCGDAGGSWGTGPPCYVIPARATTWGQIKAIYR